MNEGEKMPTASLHINTDSTLPDMSVRRRDVNLKQMSKNIAEQYEDVVEGLQKDAAQNAWDARLHKKATGFKFLMKYFPNLKGTIKLPNDVQVTDAVIIEDDGTTGMDKQRWDAFHGLWFTTKGSGGEGGIRGQGKSLFHFFSKDDLVLAESIDELGAYRFSGGTSEFINDKLGSITKILEGVPPLNHRGTRVWICNLKPEYKDELLRRTRECIESTWWEPIRNWNSEFTLDLEGHEHRVDVPDFITKPHIKKKFEQQNIPIKNLGKIRNFCIFYCDEEIPERWRGVSIQRSGMSITRLPAPASADENLRKHLWGYINFDDALELQLKECELPNHMGFAAKRAWTHAKDYIRRHFEEFIIQITPKKQQHIDVNEHALDEAARILNSLIEENAPELLGGPRAPGGSGSTKTKVPRVMQSVRIGVFKPSARRINYDETLAITCRIVNETVSHADLNIVIHLQHEKGTVKFKHEGAVNIVANNECEVLLPLIDFEKDKDAKGEYVAIAILSDRSSGNEIHQKTFSIYVEQDPPQNDNGKSFIKKFIMTRGHGTPIEKWTYVPVNEEGKMRIIWDHPAFAHAREVAGRENTTKFNTELMLYCIRCGLEEVKARLLQLKANEENFDEQLRQVLRMCDGMLFGAVQRLSNGIA